MFQRIFVVTEGQTETAFVKKVLAFYYPEKIFIPVEIETKVDKRLGRMYKGGISNFEKIRNTLLKVLNTASKDNSSYVTTMFDFSELGDFIDRPVRTYSSGMYSKLSFAVTAILDTDIMLVDEVLSVGDEHFRQKSYKKMEELMTSGRTVLIVSHATNTLKQFCDQVLWINDSKFQMLGDTDSVLKEYDAFMKL